MDETISNSALACCLQFLVFIWREVGRHIVQLYGLDFDTDSQASQSEHKIPTIIGTLTLFKERPAPHHGRRSDTVKPQQLIKRKILEQLHYYPRSVTGISVERKAII